jgi:HEAT repeat protein
VAMRALDSMQVEIKPAIPMLLKALRNREISIRQPAIEALGQLGKTAEGAIPALSDLLEDSDALTQALAARALWEITGDAAPRVHKLSEIVGREQTSVSMFTAANVLGEMGPVAVNAIPILTRTLKHNDSWARISAAQALWKIDRQQFPVAIEVLVEEISVHPSIVAYSAAKTLGEMGPDAKAAVPTLVKLRWYPDVSVRTAVARALERIDHEAAAQAGVK